MGSVAAIPQVVEERVVFYHQRAAHFYRTLGYFIGNVIVDIPFSIIETIIFTCLVFWMTGMYKGLHEPFISYCVYALVLFLTSMIAKQFARFCAASTPTLGFASSIAPAMLCVWLVFAGFLIPRSSIEWYWSWMNILSPFRYTFESLAINQLNDLSFYCSAGELVPPNTNATTPPYFGQQVCLISECCVSIETNHSARALSLSLCVCVCVCVLIGLPNSIWYSDIGWSIWIVPRRQVDLDRYGRIVRLLLVLLHCNLLWLGIPPLQAHGLFGSSSGRSRWRG